LLRRVIFRLIGFRALAGILLFGIALLRRLTLIRFGALRRLLFLGISLLW
jgi:hypothetical protein